MANILKASTGQPFAEVLSSIEKRAADGTPPPIMTVPGVDGREYARLKPFERARLLNSDPARYKRLRGDYERHVQALKDAYVSAKSFAERQDRHRALNALENLSRDSDEGPSAA